VRTDEAVAGARERGSALLSSQCEREACRQSAVVVCGHGDG